MSVSEELERLAKLHTDGALNDEEFAQAKTRLLNPPIEQTATEVDDNSLGRAANRYVQYKLVMGVVGAIVFIIFILVVTSQMGNHRDPGIIFNGPFPGH